MCWKGTYIDIFNERARFQVYVKDVRLYPDIKSFLYCEGYILVVPTAANFQNALNIYQQYYSDKDIEMDGGIAALILERVM